MNTKVTYMYRDADNYKQHEEVVLSGTIDEEYTRKLFDAQIDEGFVPSAVGLDDLQERNVNGWDKDSDHPYHELLSVTRTASSTTTPLTASDFYNRFITANWETAAMKVSQDHLQ